MQAELGPCEESYAAFVGEAGDDDVLSWTIRDNTTQIAFLQVVRDGSTTEAMLTLAVAPAWRRCGIARSVLKAALEAPALKNVRRFACTIAASSKASQTLVERVGFVRGLPKPSANGYYLFALYR